MEQGQKVWTLYMSGQFDTTTGFGGWIDEYTIINPDIGEGLMLLRGKYGGPVTRTPDEVYISYQEVREALIGAISRRIAVAEKQIEKIRAEIAIDLETKATA